MPMHDWSRVDLNVYHHFHQMWTVEIATALNQGLLPPGFSAMVEHHAGRLQPDVLALERRPRGEGGDRKPGGNVVVADPPRTRHVLRSQLEKSAARGNRIAIHHAMGDVVCMIELVSPGNKHSKGALRDFIEKSVKFLRSGIHLLVIDPFPPTKRDPHGIHKAIFDEIEETDFALTPDEPLTLAAYMVDDTGLSVTAYVEPFAVGRTLPDMPAYLDWDEYVPVPLEATYMEAWSKCPATMRELVETGMLSEGG